MIEFKLPNELMLRFDGVTEEELEGTFGLRKLSEHQFNTADKCADLEHYVQARLERLNVEAHFTTPDVMFCFIGMCWAMAGQTHKFVAPEDLIGRILKVIMASADAIQRERELIVR